ncbi:zinc finger protein [Holotrichia oblita]|uniref:Zinc finger protein n=1 Tax=Holotrichia oblita TaxID=644536 RepID=A0ACB9T9T2_HOLOL|nr:zinc finger protein [Holotrichia oblita]
MQTGTKVITDFKLSSLFKQGKPGQKGSCIVTKEILRLWFTDLKKYLLKDNCVDISKEPEEVLPPQGIKNLYSVKMLNEKQNFTLHIKA